MNILCELLCTQSLDLQVPIVQLGVTLLAGKWPTILCSDMQQVGPP